MDCNQILQIFYVWLQVIDLCKSQKDESQTGWDLIDPQKVINSIENNFFEYLPKIGKREIGRYFSTNCLSFFYE